MASLNQQEIQTPKSEKKIRQPVHQHFKNTRDASRGRTNVQTSTERKKWTSAERKEETKFISVFDNDVIFERPDLEERGTIVNRKIFQQNEKIEKHNDGRKPAVPRQADWIRIKQRKQDERKQSNEQRIKNEVENNKMLNKRKQEEEIKQKKHKRVVSKQDNIKIIKKQPEITDIKILDEVPVIKKQVEITVIKKQTEVTVIKKAVPVIKKQTDTVVIQKQTEIPVISNKERMRLYDLERREKYKQSQQKKEISETIKEPKNTTIQLKQLDKEDWYDKTEDWKSARKVQKKPVSEEIVSCAGKRKCIIF